MFEEKCLYEAEPETILIASGISWQKAKGSRQISNLQPSSLPQTQGSTRTSPSTSSGTGKPATSNQQPLQD